MNKIALATLAGLFSLNLWADPCPAFTGIWSADISVGEEAPSYYPIRFVNEEGNLFQVQKIIYNPRYRFSERYIVDDEDHRGDSKHTGDIYNVQCSSERLVITKKYEGQQIQIDDYSFEGKSLILKEISGNNQKLSKFVRQD